MARIPVGGRSGIGGDDRVVGQDRGELGEQSQRIDRVGRYPGLHVHRLPPAGDVGLDALAPRPVLFALELRDQCSQRGPGVRHQVDLVRVPHADEPGVDVDLYSARLSVIGHELAVGEARPHGEQRVAAGHHLVARPGAEQADGSGDPGQLVGQHVLAQQGLRGARTEQVGRLGEFGVRPPGPGADQHRDLGAGVEDVGGPPDGVVVRGDLRKVETEAGRHHLEGVGRWRVRQLLHVGGDDEGRRRTLRERGADGAVEDVGQLLGHVHGLHVVGGHVLVQARQVHLLLIGAAHRAPVGLPDDRYHGNVVQLGVVEAVEQVDRARAGRRHTHPDPAGELRVSDGFEGAHLLVPGLHEPGVVVGSTPRGEDPVDAVARVREHVLDVPRP